MLFSFLKTYIESNIIYRNSLFYKRHFKSTSAYLFSMIFLYINTVDRHEMSRESVLSHNV